jgi:hypothetical protein
VPGHEGIDLGDRPAPRDPFESLSEPGMRIDFIHLRGLQSRLGWKTPSEFAITCNPRRDLALRYAEGSAPAPVATTAQTATSNRLNELKIG